MAMPKDVSNQSDYFSGHYKCYGLNVQAVVRSNVEFISLCCRSHSHSRYYSGEKAKIADDEFEAAMTDFIKDTLHRNRVQNTITAKAVVLAEDFK